MSRARRRLLRTLFPFPTPDLEEQRRHGWYGAEGTAENAATMDWLDNDQGGEE
jgi:hypothetical protein